MLLFFYMMMHPSIQSLVRYFKGINKNASNERKVLTSTYTWHTDDVLCTKLYTRTTDDVSTFMYTLADLNVGIARVALINCNHCDDLHTAISQYARTYATSDKMSKYPRDVVIDDAYVRATYIMYQINEHFIDNNTLSIQGVFMDNAMYMATTHYVACMKNRMHVDLKYVYFPAYRCDDNRTSFDYVIREIPYFVNETTANFKKVTLLQVSKCKSYDNLCVYMYMIISLLHTNGIFMIEIPPPSHVTAFTLNVLYTFTLLFDTVHVYKMKYHQCMYTLVGLSKKKTSITHAKRIYTLVQQMTSKQHMYPIECIRAFLPTISDYLMDKCDGIDCDTMRLSIDSVIKCTRL